jgi:hypothetical protein
MKRPAGASAANIGPCPFRSELTDREPRICQTAAHHGVQWGLPRRVWTIGFIVSEAASLHYLWVVRLESRACIPVLHCTLSMH